jgi:hypothetical protein
MAEGVHGMIVDLNMNSGSGKVNTGTSDIWLGDDGIIRQVLHNGVDETIDDAKDAIKTMLDLSCGIKRVIFVYIRGLKSITRDARKFLSEESSKHFNAAAMLVDSPVTRTIGNFVMKITPPDINAKIFSDEGKAVAWLKAQMK